jgi:Asp-tRNA(Asn)/Glu-tRNA(Gln) amidotransferase A subunit family amidase
MKTIYIAGKITGLPIEEARANFDKAEKKLTKQGFKVINPMKLPHNHDKKWESYMKECITELIKCDSIYLLNNWAMSRGAIMEFEISMKLDIEVIY